MYRHTLSYYVDRKRWIVKSETEDGEHSLQFVYRQKPNDEQLKQDFAFLDGKLDLATKWQDLRKDK